MFPLILLTSVMLVHILSIMWDRNLLILLVPIFLFMVFLRYSSLRRAQNCFFDLTNYLAYNPLLCLICVEPHTFGLETQCGHKFCGRCFMLYYELYSEMQTVGVHCPQCQERVTILFIRYTQEEIIATDHHAVTRNAITVFANRYNLLMYTVLRVQRWTVPNVLRRIVDELTNFENMWIIVCYPIMLQGFGMLINVLAYYDFINEIFHTFCYYISKMLGIIIIIYYFERIIRNVVVPNY